MFRLCYSENSGEFRNNDSWGKKLPTNESKNSRSLYKDSLAGIFASVGFSFKSR